MAQVTVPSPLVQELAVGHVLMMQCGASALRILECAKPAAIAHLDLRAGDEAIRMAGLSARLMRHHTDGTLLLRRLPAAVRVDAPASAGQPAVAPAVVAPSDPRKFHAASNASRGRLRNGNPSGDYLKAPRCGARTRAGGCCRQPAMANGRCRMHGGLSTGPRTPEGLTRCRATRLVHGYRTRAHIGLRSRAVHAARRLRNLTAHLRTFSAGHGLHRSESRSQKSEAGTQRPSAAEVLRSDFWLLASSFSAGYGLHRSVRDHLRSSASICGFRSLAPAPPMRNFVLQSAAALR